MNVEDLKPSGYNPRKISDKASESLRKAMLEFGDLSGVVFNVRTKTLIGGHQRAKHIDPTLKIVKEPVTDNTGTVAVGHIDTPSGRWQYREVDWSQDKEMAANIAANKHGGEFDIPKLKDMLVDLDTGAFDLSLTGFDDNELKKMIEFDQKYTNKIIAPVYEPSGEKPEISDLYDSGKSSQLIEQINSADIPEDEKAFLIKAAGRHVVFDYRAIANYYAHSESVVQELMEKSALVIIDFDQAIEEGYVRLAEDISAQFIRESGIDEE